MARNVLHAVIMGAPGSGKGTISKRIVKDFGLKFLSSGDVLRSQILHRTDVGLECEAYMKRGQLVPDTIMDAMVLKDLFKLHNDSWLLDGFPRNLVQAEALHRVETMPDVVIDLIVPFDVIIDRIRGRLVHLPSGRLYHTEFSPPKVAGRDDVTGEPLVQRVDDKPETVLERLKAYQKQTEPVNSFYKKKGILAEFHGKESNEIWPRVRHFMTSVRQPVAASEY